MFIPTKTEAYGYWKLCDIRLRLCVDIHTDSACSRRIVWVNKAVVVILQQLMTTCGLLIYFQHHKYWTEIYR